MIPLKSERIFFYAACMGFLYVIYSYRFYATNISQNYSLQFSESGSPKKYWGRTIIPDDGSTHLLETTSKPTEKATENLKDILVINPSTKPAHERTTEKMKDMLVINPSTKPTHGKSTEKLKDILVINPSTKPTHGKSTEKLKDILVNNPSTKPTHERATEKLKDILVINSSTKPTHGKSTEKLKDILVINPSTKPAQKRATETLKDILVINPSTKPTHEKSSAKLKDILVNNPSTNKPTREKATEKMKDILVINPSTEPTHGKSTEKFKDILVINPSTKPTREMATKKLKHILVIIPSKNNHTCYIFRKMGQGQSEFKKLGCKYDNCFVTNKTDHFSNLTRYDAVAFSGEHLPLPKDLPPNRSAKQKYIFVGTESAHVFGVCNSKYDAFFNWTWTYKLDSDVLLTYVTIYDLNGVVVGPKIDMTWPKLDPISEKLKSSLGSKKKVAAWVVSHCKTLSERENFVKDLQATLETKRFGWTVDVYGRCGTLKCDKDCFNILKRDYYFYFAFENSFAEDYVTEKLLRALNNNAVPVVFGAANYSRNGEMWMEDHNILLSLPTPLVRRA